MNRIDYYPVHGVQNVCPAKEFAKVCVAGEGRDAFHLQDQNLRQDREDKTKESPSESFHMT